MTEPLSINFFKDSGINKAECQVLWQVCQSTAKKHFYSSNEIAKAMYHYVRNHPADMAARLEELDPVLMQAAFQALVERFRLGPTPEKLEDRQKLFKFLEKQPSRWLNPSLTTVNREESILQISINSAANPSKKKRPGSASVSLHKTPSQQNVACIPTMSQNEALSTHVNAPLPPNLLLQNPKNMLLKPYLLWLNVRYALAGLTHADLVQLIDHRKVDNETADKLGLATDNRRQELLTQFQGADRFNLLPLDAKRLIVKFWGSNNTEILEFKIDTALANYLGLDQAVDNPSDWIKQQLAAWCIPPAAAASNASAQPTIDPRVVAEGRPSR